MAPLKNSAARRRKSLASPRATAKTAPRKAKSARSPKTAPVTIRGARRGDAARIAQLANRLNVLMGERPDKFSKAVILRDVFGKRAILSALVAESGGKVVGYALVQDSYNTDLAERALWLTDLMVDERHQGNGAGKMLMAAVARETLARGGTSLAWAVMGFNGKALRFYEALGGKDWDTRIIEMEGAPLRRLAREAPR